ELFPRLVREAVRLVARAREEEERRRMLAERDGIFLIGQIHAIDDLLLHIRRLAGGGESCFFLRQRDDRQLMQTEIVRRGERDRELTTPAVDDEQVRQLPIDGLARRVLTPCLRRLPS